MTSAPIASSTQPSVDGPPAVDKRPVLKALPGTMARGEAAAYLGCSLYAVDRLCRRYGVERTRSPRGYLYVTRQGLARIRAQLTRIRSGVLLTESAAAARVGMSRTALRSIVARGALKPALQAPRARYFHPDDLDDLTARMTREGYVPTAQACEKLGVTRQRVSQLVRTGRLHPDVDPLGNRCFAVAELDVYRKLYPRPGQRPVPNV